MGKSKTRIGELIIMSMLKPHEIHHRIFSEPIEAKRLVVSPLLDAKSQIEASSIDLRLGSHFIVQKQANISHLDPYENEMGNDGIITTALETHSVIPMGKYFVLHPNQFVLGGTLEYIKMQPLPMERLL